MSQCLNKSFKFGNLCILSDDFYLLIFNILVIGIISGVVYLKYFINSKKDNLQVILKNNFCNLGEGSLKHFYTQSNVQQKTTGTKKKVQQKTNPQTANAADKQPSNNELKCNFCSRSVEVSYQFTINKLNQIMQ
jgi:hypothetical protein